MVDRLLATGGTGVVASGVATPRGEPCHLVDDSCPFQSNSSFNGVQLLLAGECCLLITARIVCIFLIWADLRIAWETLGHHSRRHLCRTGTAGS